VAAVLQDAKRGVSLCSSGMPLAFGPWKRTTAMKSPVNSPALKAAFSAVLAVEDQGRRLDDMAVRLDGRP
jgi:hypothetical protein